MKKIVLILVLISFVVVLSGSKVSNNDGSRMYYYTDIIELKEKLQQVPTEDNYYVVELIVDQKYILDANYSIKVIKGIETETKTLMFFYRPDSNVITNSIIVTEFYPINTEINTEDITCVNVGISNIYVDCFYNEEQVLDNVTIKDYTKNICDFIEMDEFPNRYQYGFYSGEILIATLSFYSFTNVYCLEDAFFEQSLVKYMQNNFQLLE